MSAIRQTIAADLYREAVLLVVEEQRASVSLLQRKLRIGYSKAKGIIDRMAQEGVIGEYCPRHGCEVLMESADEVGTCESCGLMLYDESDYCSDSEGIVWCKSHGEISEP